MIDDIIGYEKKGREKLYGYHMYWQHHWNIIIYHYS